MKNFTFFLVFLLTALLSFATMAQVPAAGLQLWLRADAGIVLNGSTVSQWMDQSGNGNDAVQADTNRLPAFVNNGLNNKPVLHFDGVNDRLGLSGSSTMSQISLFLVFKIDSGLIDNGMGPIPYHPVIFGNSNTNLFMLGMRNSFTGNSPNIIDVVGTNVPDLGVVHAESPDIAAFDQWKIVSVITNRNILNTTFRSNGIDANIVQEGTNILLSVPIGTPNGTTGIGGGDGLAEGDFIFKGDIAEVILYDTVRTNSERAAIENYLADKYNITITDVVDNQNGSLPEEFILEQNYPNPFNPSTTVKYSIPTSEFVSLKVYDVLGNEVATLVTGEKRAGSYEIEFNAASLSSGIYFYTLKAGKFSETKKLILTK